MPALIAALLLAFIAVVHSVLGERVILKPLFADERWSARLPRWVHERILRFAWHLTSVAWVGLAAIAAGASPEITVVGVAFVSAGMIASRLPSHLAWPLFIAAGLALAADSEMVAPTAWRITAGVAAVVAAGLALLHLYWAAGGQRWITAALPHHTDGTATFTPGRVGAASVAAALLGLCGLLAALAAGSSHAVVRWLSVAAFVVLAARVAGDGRYVGVTKKVRTTRFARLDDLAYTPLAVLLATGSATAFWL